MRNSQRYRHNANVCLRAAHNADGSRYQSLNLLMAQAWLKLAGQDRGDRPPIRGVGNRGVGTRRRGCSALSIKRPRPTDGIADNSIGSPLSPASLGKREAPSTALTPLLSLSPRVIRRARRCRRTGLCQFDGAPGDDLSREHPVRHCPGAKRRVNSPR